MAENIEVQKDEEANSLEAAVSDSHDFHVPTTLAGKDGLVFGFLVLVIIVSARPHWRNWCD